MTDYPYDGGVQSDKMMATPPTRGGRIVQDAVRRWKSITLHLPGWAIDEFADLARVLGTSRVALMRDAMVTAGLAYARGMAKGKQAETEKAA